MGIILIIILALLVALIAYVIWGTALFHKIEIQKTVFPETRIAYITFIGDYSQAYKQTSIIEKAVKDEYNVDWSHEPCLGIYYDDPRKVDREKCRCIVGKIIPENFPEVKAPSNITFDVIPRIDPIFQVEYPLRSILSIFAAMARVYPAINNYTQQNGTEIKSAMLEIYGYRNNKLLFAGSSNKGTGLWKEFPKSKNE